MADEYVRMYPCGSKWNTLRARRPARVLELESEIRAGAVTWM